MRRSSVSPVSLIPPDWPAPAWVRAAASTRQGGVSSTPYDSLNLATHCGDDPAQVERNRALWAQRAGLPGPPVWLNQVHGIDVAVDPRSEHEITADAAVSTRPNRPLVVMTADCVPILLCARDTPWVAVVHAGWRGLAGGVIAAACAHAPKGAQLIAWIGPSIRSAHYEVDAVVRAPLVEQDRQAARFFHPIAGKRWLADLPGIALHQLKTLDVAGFDSRLDAFGDPRRFYSYRRDRGRTGRQACAIWMLDAQ